MSNDHTPAAASCCSHTAATSTPAASPAATGNLLGPSADQLTTCPVMEGSTVVKPVAEAAGLYRDYKGKRYWFCCAGCGPLFDADPDRYAAAA
jgi:YHS domain-containing protein